MALVVTPGATDATSYCSIAQADAYHEGHVARGLWVDEDAEVKEAALRQATRMLDAHVEWRGQSVSRTQALMWPLYGAFDRNGYPIDHTTIPGDVVNATAEFARQLIATDRSADSDVATAGLRRLKAGPVELEFNAQVQGAPIPDAVFWMVRHLGTVRSSRGAGSVPVTRV